MNANLKFSDRVVIVTGATRGLGLAISKAFMKEGAEVVGLYRSNHSAADELKKEAEAEGWKLELHAVDVSDYSAVEEFYKSFRASHCKLDILINNSGIRKDKVIAMMSAKEWQEVMDVNLGGSFNMSKFAIMEMMPNRYGRIVMITSPMGRDGFSGLSNYAASKAGQTGMLRSISKEVARRGITVNGVSPGFAETELIEGLDEKTLQEYKKLIPLRRFAKPEEIASAVLYLSSEEAAYITGTTLEVSGGL